jgi:hypothetical protein
MYAQHYFEEAYVKTHRTMDSLHLLELSREHHCLEKLLSYLIRNPPQGSPSTATLHFDPVEPTESENEQDDDQVPDYESDHLSINS